MYINSFNEEIAGDLTEVASVLKPLLCLFGRSVEGGQQCRNSYRKTETGTPVATVVSNLHFER